MPEKTLLAFAEHGDAKGAMRIDGGGAEAVLADFSAAGVNDQTLAADQQRKGTAAIAKSWNELMSRIASKREVLR
jgi:transaldolase